MKTKVLMIAMGLFLLIGAISLSVWLGNEPLVSLYHAPTPTPQPSWRRSVAGIYTPPDEPIAGERVTLQAAWARLPYTIPLPGYLPGDTEASYLAEVWVSPAESNFHSLALVYSLGITIIVHQDPHPTNWSSLAESPFTLIKVNGYTGIGKDPGDQDLDGSIWHYPGSVSWQVGKFQITVYGEYPMSELLKVAESMDIAHPGD